MFELLVSCIQAGRSVRFDDRDFNALLRLSEELENSELASSLLGLVNLDSLSLDEALLLLREGVRLGVSAQFESSSELVASHFHELQEENLKNLDFETAQLLLSSPLLCIKDEDSLFGFIMSRCESDMSFTRLLQFVFFEYLSISSVTLFISFVNKYSLEKMNGELWKRVCARLVQTSEVAHRNPRVAGSSSVKVIDNSKNLLKGIIAHLTRKCHGNVHLKGIVEVTASTMIYNSVAEYGPQFVVDFRTDNCYRSQNIKDSWICYDFRERRVVPTSYTLKSNGWGHLGHFHPRPWVFEASNGGISWTELDRRDNVHRLNDKNATQNFQISPTVQDEYRFVRLRQTGKNWQGTDHLILNAMEIFGSIKEL